MVDWIIERMLHFDFAQDIVRSGLAHFGFYDRRGRYFAVDHRKHFMGLVGEDDRLQWTVAARPVFPDVPNISAPLDLPMYVDALSEDAFVVSNFKTAELYRIDPLTMAARLLVDGHALGLVDMGNCVVDDEGYIWVNEVTGCRLWRFDSIGGPVETLGDGTPGFQADTVPFGESRFSWIYDIRRGPDHRSMCWTAATSPSASSTRHGGAFTRSREMAGRDTQATEETRDTRGLVAIRTQSSMGQSASLWTRKRTCTLVTVSTTSFA